MNELLLGLGNVFCQWLEKQLPLLGSAWWTDNVVNRLTFQQQRSIQDKRIDSLSHLDLAALLRGLDQNWHELSAIQSLPRDARSWVKELQAVRNRWAHVPSSGFSPEDTYRDADTLGRLLNALGAEGAAISKVELFKKQTLAQMVPTRSLGGRN